MGAILGGWSELEGNSKEPDIKNRPVAYISRPDSHMISSRQEPLNLTPTSPNSSYRLHRDPTSSLRDLPSCDATAYIALDLPCPNTHGPAPRGRISTSSPTAPPTAPTHHGSLTAPASLPFPPCSASGASFRILHPQMPTFSNGMNGSAPTEEALLRASASNSRRPQSAATRSAPPSMASFPSLG